MDEFIISIFYDIDNFCKELKIFFEYRDNADNSYDSRYWEEPFVKHQDVIAQLFSFNVKWMR